VIVFLPLKRQLSFRFSIRRCDRLFDGSGSWRRKRQREYYLANVTMIDEKVGEILKALEAKGLQDDRVVVVFTSDDGDTLGDHGQSQKWTMYEQVLRVPLIVWSPRAATKSLAVPALVQHMDRRHDLDFTGVETELERLKAAVSTGYARGKLFEVAKTLPRDRGDWYD
jgi:membrane-anchored protein YejM (alkaline phosphatase superfamily)